MSLGHCLLGQSGLVKTLYACRTPPVGQSQVCPAFRVGGDGERGRGWSNVASSNYTDILSLWSSEFPASHKTVDQDVLVALSDFIHAPAWQC